MEILFDIKRIFQLYCKLNEIAEVEREENSILEPCLREETNSFVQPGTNKTRLYIKSFEGGRLLRMTSGAPDNVS